MASFNHMVHMALMLYCPKPFSLVGTICANFQNIFVRKACLQHYFSGTSLSFHYKHDNFDVTSSCYSVCREVFDPIIKTIKCITQLCSNFGLVICQHRFRNLDLKAFFLLNRTQVCSLPCAWPHPIDVKPISVDMKIYLSICNKFNRVPRIS